MQTKHLFDGILTVKTEKFRLNRKEQTHSYEAEAKQVNYLLRNKTNYY